MKARRIVVVLPDLRGGGAERLHIVLAEYWQKKGFDVTFALMGREGELLGILPSSIGVVDLGARRIRQVIRPLSNYLRRVRPDFIVVAMWPLTSAAVVAWILAGKPGRLFLSDHNQLSIACLKERNTPPWLLRAAMRWTYPVATGIIAVSRGVRDDMCELGALKHAQVRVIYNPAAIGMQPVESPKKIVEGLWGDGFDHHILSVGTLKAQKDHETLIRAFALVASRRNAKLVILGEGPLRPTLEALVAELKLTNRVALPGFVINPYPWYQSADLFVLSSRWEGFGNVIVEALECGIPVVSTDCASGPSEILQGGRIGRLVSVQDPVALAAAISATLACTTDVQVLTTRAQDFSVAAIADQYLAYFAEST